MYRNTYIIIIVVVVVVVVIIIISSSSIIILFTANITSLVRAALPIQSDKQEKKYVAPSVIGPVPFQLFGSTEQGRPAKTNCHATPRCRLFHLFQCSLSLSEAGCQSAIIYLRQAPLSGEIRPCHWVLGRIRGIPCEETIEEKYSHVIILVGK